MDIPWACVKFRTSFDAFQKRENLDRIKRRTQQSNIWKTKNYFSWWVKKKREKKTNELYNNNLTATATKIIKLSEWTERCAFLFPALISRRAGAWIIILYIWMLHIMKNNTRSLWKKKENKELKYAGHIERTRNGTVESLCTFLFFIFSSVFIPWVMKLFEIIFLPDRFPSRSISSLAFMHQYRLVSRRFQPFFKNCIWFYFYFFLSFSLAWQCCTFIFLTMSSRLNRRTSSGNTNRRKIQHTL